MSQKTTKGVYLKISRHDDYKRLTKRMYDDHTIGDNLRHSLAINRKKKTTNILKAEQAHVQTSVEEGHQKGY